MHTYTCYGLTLESQIPLPELGDELGKIVEPDIVIERGDVHGPPDDAAMIRSGMWRSPTSIGIDIPEVARFVAHSGHRIVVSAAPGVPGGDVRIFLLGTMLGSIMMQRDHLVLHGNAFRIGDACAVVVGSSGAGKSTLAAELASRGIDVLSDDVVPVDSKGHGLPGYPRIKLWRDALDALGLDVRQFERITATHEKFHVPLKRAALAPLPLRWVFALEKHDGASLELDEVTGVDAFDLLNEHTYRRELVHGTAASWQHLQQCAALAARARIVRVNRPVATMTAGETADAVLTDIRTHPHAAQPSASQETA